MKFSPTLGVWYRKSSIERLQLTVEASVHNMFSYQSSQAHRERRRIIAAAYSKTAITRPSVQHLIIERISKLLRYLDQQTSSAQDRFRKSEPIVVRHIFRALQADIFTAFAFSEEVGTTFLDNLRAEPNTMEDLGMGMMDLCHEDRRDAYFFWESEKPFKHFLHFLSRKGPSAHKKVETWLAELAKKYESKTIVGYTDQIFEHKLQLYNESPYKKICQWRDPLTGHGLTFNERASEILDHTVAGQDPVPAALEFTLKQLSIRPDVQCQLRSELSSSLPLNEGHYFSTLDKLPYLNAVVMESLRLLDNISSYQTRVVPSGGCLILGTFLPAGVSHWSDPLFFTPCALNSNCSTDVPDQTIISAQPYLINRQADIFPKPESFDPARWLLPEDKYKTLARHLWTYSSGPRACIGRELSLASTQDSFTLPKSREQVLMKHSHQNGLSSYLSAL